jgi:hypothetical protein
MVIHVCCKFLFSMFHLFFSNVCCKCVYLDVAYVSHICCKYFILMLRMFYNDFQVFLQVFQMHVSSVLSVFRCILQVLCLDVSKVYRMLHLSPHFPLPRLSFSSSSWRRLGIHRPLPLSPMLMAFGAVGALHGCAKRGGKQTTRASVRTPRLSGRPGASKPGYISVIFVPICGKLVTLHALIWHLGFVIKMGLLSSKASWNTSQTILMLQNITL